MINGNVIHTNECKCLGWKPIIAGALVAVGLSFLLNLFSVAIGLTAFTTNSEGVQTLVFGGLIGTGIGIIVSMFGAGWLSGYLSQRHCSKGHLGALYGFLTWCVALLILVFVSSHIQEYVSFYGHYLSGTTEVIQVNNGSPSSSVAVATSASAKDLTVSAYIMFSMFFLSAFACSLGGHCGMRHCCDDSSC